MISDLIDELRTGISGCEALVFVDIASCTVLCASSAQKLPQENLDAYCAAAAELLDGDTGLAVAQIQGGDDEGLLFDAMVVSDNQNLFFQRSLTDPAEALICVCTAPVDVASVAQATRAGLEQITAKN